MPALKWDLDKFRQLCHNTGIKGYEVYLNSLCQKKLRAEWFSNDALDVWNNLFAEHGEISTDSDEWQKAENKAEAYLEASLYNIHSLADVLSQVINVVVLCSLLTERECSLLKVFKKLNDRNDTSLNTLIDSVDRLRNSDEFKYVEAFVNTSKHRRILIEDFRAEASQGYQQGMRVQGFIFNDAQNPFPEKWDSEIKDEIIPSIINSVSSIGNEMNAYLR